MNISFTANVISKY